MKKQRSFRQRVLIGLIVMVVLTGLALWGYFSIANNMQEQIVETENLFKHFSLNITTIRLFG